VRSAEQELGISVKTLAVGTKSIGKTSPNTQTTLSPDKLGLFETVAPIGKGGTGGAMRPREPGKATTSV
jgi:hypothetical protein